MTSEAPPRPGPPAQQLVETASHNRDQLQAMFDNLAAIAQGPGLSWDVIAQRAGTTPARAESMASGREDITLSDLEVLLAAAGARIRIDIEPDS